MLALNIMDYLCGPASFFPTNSGIVEERILIFSLPMLSICTHVTGALGRFSRVLKKVLLLLFSSDRAQDRASDDVAGGDPVGILRKFYCRRG